MPESREVTPKSFTLHVRTPEGETFEDQVRAVRFPGIDGYLGVLPRHAPMVTAVSCGVLHVELLDGARDRFAIGEGFAEVYPTATTLLVDFLNGDEDVDVDRAHGALRRADQRMRDRHDSVDLARAEAALCRAITRLKICGCGCSLCDKHC